jgi:ABC-type antimicrobial peptide transport system permease subunit
VHKWEELIPGVLQLIVLDQISGELTLAFLILIMSFGVLNTIQMSIHERIREFGVMMAIGIKARVLLKMVLMELLILLIPGILIGALLGSGISYYFELNPIILKGEDAEMFASSGFAPVLRTIVDLRELWIGVLSLVLPTCIFSYIAARRILKLEPVKAIQTI